MTSPNFPGILTELIAIKKIPSLDEGQASFLSHYLFAKADRPLRIQVAEIAYRDHDHPNALDLFLACTLPLAQKVAERKAYRIFVYPSDWQLEMMYDGAVSAVITMFLRNAPLTSVPDAFRRYLLRTLALGSIRDYFKRDENFGIKMVEDLAAAFPRTTASRNTIEDDAITRELLKQVTSYPNLPPFVRKTLKCIAKLGPDAALKTHAFTASGDSAKWKRAKTGAPILDPVAIAKARGVSKAALHLQLWKARVALRQAFNADGRLFMTR